MVDRGVFDDLPVNVKTWNLKCNISRLYPECVSGTTCLPRIQLWRWRIRRVSLMTYSPGHNLLKRVYHEPPALCWSNSRDGEKGCLWWPSSPDHPRDLKVETCHLQDVTHIQNMGWASKDLTLELVDRGVFDDNPDILHTWNLKSIISRP